jgi:hypothetical protein
MKTVSTSPTPTNAPADFRTLPAKVVVKDGDGLFETWHGSGVATELACAACGNEAGNLQIYGNWGFSYPNGHSWDDREIVCGVCGQFTLELRFEEG